MERLMNLLSEEEILTHLTPVEQRIYRGSDRLGQLKLICSSKYVDMVGQLAKGIFDQTQAEIPPVNREENHV